MNNHIFVPSSKKDILYCKECQKLSFNGNISQSLNCHFKFDIDPLSLKFIPFSSIVNYKSLYHLKYIENKNIGISKINFLVNKFGLKSMVFYRAISLMDQIYLENQVSIESIENIACICVLLVIEFNECCLSNKGDDIIKKEKEILFRPYFENNHKKNKANITGLFHYIKNNINNYDYWEVLCLKYLNYDLGKYSAYDYLILFFGLGIFFCKETIDIIDKLNTCLRILDYIINDSKSCNYSQYILAMSIIKVAFEEKKYFDKKIFKKIYGVDLSKKKYINCSNMIKVILNMALNYQLYSIICSFNSLKNINSCNYINNSPYLINGFINSDEQTYYANEKRKNKNKRNKKNNKCKEHIYNNKCNNKIIIIDSNLNNESRNKFKCDSVHKNFFVNNHNKIIINNNFINNSININNYNFYFQNYLKKNNYNVNTFDINNNNNN